MSCQGANLSMLFAFWLTVDGHGLCPRDNKITLVWGRFTELAMVTPAPPLHGNIPWQQPYRPQPKFRNTLFALVNPMSSKQ